MRLVFSTNVWRMSSCDAALRRHELHPHSPTLVTQPPLAVSRRRALRKASAPPGCATWGYTRKEALHNIHDAVEAYIRDLQNAGEEIPRNATTQVIEEPVVAITV